MSSTVRRLVRDMRLRDARLAGTETQGADYHQLRSFNRLLVLNCIRQQGPVARVEIARIFGLSRTTVSSIVDELLQDGLAEEGSVMSAAPNGGRRATLVHFNAGAGVCLGVDIGRTHLTIVAADLSGTIFARQAGVLHLERGPDICVPEIIDRLRQFAGDHGVLWERVIGVGVGIPGTLDSETRILVNPPHMRGWNGVDVRSALQDALHVPMYMDNDANMGALGESRYGAGRGINHFIYVKLGTGIGSGLIVNNQVYRGSGGFAGEIGHISFGEVGPRCDCGNSGCLESIAGAEAIVADALHFAKIAADNAGDVAATKDCTPPVDIADVIQAAHAGDHASRMALERAATRIGTALGAMINLLNPAAIILDGGVARAGDLLLTPLRRVVATKSIPAAWKPTSILIGELENQAIAMGAIATVIDVAFEIPSLAAEQMSLSQSTE